MVKFASKPVYVSEIAFAHGKAAFLWDSKLATIIVHRMSLFAWTDSFTVSLFSTRLMNLILSKKAVCR